MGRETVRAGKMSGDYVREEMSRGGDILHSRTRYIRSVQTCQQNRKALNLRHQRSVNICIKVSIPSYSRVHIYTQLAVCISRLFRKAHRRQFAGRVYTVEQLAGTADAGLFKAIASSPNHSLYQILPPFRPNQYSLRKP